LILKGETACASAKNKRRRWRKEINPTTKITDRIDGLPHISLEVHWFNSWEEYVY